MSESERDHVVRVLDAEGACCGQCGREPGSPLADCPDCERVLGRYADALAAAGLLRDEPEWEYGAGLLAAALPEERLTANDALHRALDHHIVDAAHQCLPDSAKERMAVEDLHALADVAVEAAFEAGVRVADAGEVERLRAATAPTPCVMTHTEPFDFAQCETHDEVSRRRADVSGEEMLAALDDGTAEERFGHSVAVEMDGLRPFLGSDS